MQGRTLRGKTTTSPRGVRSTRGSPLASRQVKGGKVDSRSPGYCRAGRRCQAGDRPSGVRREGLGGCWLSSGRAQRAGKGCVRAAVADLDRDSERALSERERRLKLSDCKSSLSDAHKQ